MFAQLIDATLNISIHVFSVLFVSLFCIEIQIAWENQIYSYAAPAISNSKPEVIEKVIEIKNATAIKGKSRVQKNELRQQCEQAGINWKFAQLNASTKRKRHLTKKEMILELNSI